MTDQPPPKTFPNIQGRCPACRGDSLFISTGGWITCSRIDCPNPSAADELLHGEHVTASTPLVCSDERHAAKVADLEQQLANVHALRDDLRGITGARWIADALDKILTSPGPAATEGTEPPKQRCDCPPTNAGLELCPGCPGRTKEQQL